ncbi:MAG: anti-sigma factor domain-containing protein [Bacillota bacterium]|nr:anti-sigma factor domain-containing protein [Bacillota bacterium]MDW7677630.1 anti-sigma factor domain-containing protein [Bacillota bacterium]
MKHKGSIIEVRRHTVIIMTDSCEFIEIPRQQQALFPGMEIEFALPENITPIRTKKRDLLSLRKTIAFVAVAAILMLAVIGGAFWMPSVSAQPAFLVSVDLNPSLTLTLDGAGRVIEAEALNDDAKMMNLKTVKNMTLEEALKELLREADEAGFLPREREHYMVISLLNLDPMADDGIMNEMLDRTMITLEQDTSKDPLQVYIVAMAANGQQAEEAETLDIPLNQVVVRDALQRRRPEGAESGRDNADDSEASPMVELVREMLDQKTHPVFVKHPGSDPDGEKERHVLENGQERIHPVFEVHPGDLSVDDKKSDEDREHPVFETYPRDVTDDMKSNPAGKNVLNQESEKNHPVFDEHPGTGAGKENHSAD